MNFEQWMATIKKVHERERLIQDYENEPEFALVTIHVSDDIDLILDTIEEARVVINQVLDEAEGNPWNLPMNFFIGVHAVKASDIHDLRSHWRGKLQEGDPRRTYGDMWFGPDEDKPWYLKKK